MGYLFGRVCHSTFGDWADSYYGGMQAFYLPGATTYEVVPKKSAGGVWEVCRATISSTGVRTSQGCTAGPVQAADLASCLPESHLADGAAVGFLVAACFVLVWGGIVVRRQLQ